MAVPSVMEELGTAMPGFALPDVASGAEVTDDSLRADVVVVVFLCNHCPYVKRIQDGLAEFSRDYEGRIAMVGIASNDTASHPDDAPEELARVAREKGYRFPVLFDADQSVARAFRAACTPDFFVYDGNHRLSYRGQFDGARPSNTEPVTGADLRAAVDALLAGEAVPADQVPSIGCSIKWAPGNEPPLVIGR
jgi:peroxiredoxin